MPIQALFNPKRGIMNHYNNSLNLLGTESFFDALSTNLPPVFTREEASQMMGGIFSPKTLSNFDASHSGPRLKLKIGKKVAYEKNDFLQWLRHKLYNKEQYNVKRIYN